VSPAAAVIAVAVETRSKQYPVSFMIGVSVMRLGAVRQSPRWSNASAASGIFSGVGRTQLPERLQLVFQILDSARRDDVPVIRDYIVDEERRLLEAVGWKDVNSP
jgi:hypothetical protein